MGRNKVIRYTKVIQMKPNIKENLKTLKSIEYALGEEQRQCLNCDRPIDICVVCEKEIKLNTEWYCGDLEASKDKHVEADHLCKKCADKYLEIEEE